MKELKMLIHISCCVVLLSAVSALNCNGMTDLVIAIPGSKEQVPQKDFNLLEDFLIDVVNYYPISKANTNVGLLIYGKEPEIITPLNMDLDKRDINTRISLMAQRELYHNINGGQNVVKAMNSIIDIHSASRRLSAFKIGVIFTYGTHDLSATTNQEIAALITDAGQRAKAAGITIFTVTIGGLVPGFEFLGKDRCSLFSMGDITGLPDLLKNIASAICYVSDPTVNPTPSQCFPVTLPPKQQQTMSCPPPRSGFFADINNCAYFIECTQRGRVRKRCAGGTVWDQAIRSCNNKEHVSCYSKISCPRGYGLFSHPFDCGKYLNCFRAIPYIQSCSEGLFFNGRVGYCDKQCVSSRPSHGFRNFRS